MDGQLSVHFRSVIQLVSVADDCDSGECRSQYTPAAHPPGELTFNYSTARFSDRLARAAASVILDLRNHAADGFYFAFLRESVRTFE
jgi:hypothetical protein